jgi:uncharacterized lipoprotein YmbA
MRGPAWQVTLACAAVLFGCASPRERLYTLSGPQAPAAVTPPKLHVLVGPVTIPEAVDRPQLVVRHNSVRLVALEQERWAEPLREGISRVLSDAITTKLPNVSATSFAATPNARWDMRLFVDVTRFEAIPGERVIIEAYWQLQVTADRKAPDGRSVIVKAVQGGPQDYDAIVAAQAAGLAEVGAELSQVIAEEAAGLATP